VRFVESSLGSPREWKRWPERGYPPPEELLPRQVLPA
jgi:hypothetical protein